MARRAQPHNQPLIATLPGCKVGVIGDETAPSQLRPRHMTRGRAPQSAHIHHFTVM